MEAVHAGQVGNAAALLANKATRDLGPSPELTPLHVAVRSGNAATVVWLLERATGEHAIQWDPELFRLVLDKTPAAAMQYLDQFAAEQPVTLAGSDRSHKSDRNRVVAVNYRELQKLYGEPHVRVDDSALGIVISSGERGKHVLPHRVFRYIMRAKWNAFAKRSFRQQFVIYCAFVTAYYFPTICANPEWIHLNNFLDYLVLLMRISAWFCALYLLARVEYPELRDQGAKSYFSTLWNLLNAISYGAALVTVPLEFITSLADIRDSLLALLTVAMWVNMLQFLQMSTTSGLLLTMMTRMIRDIYQFLIMYAVFLLGFTGAFYIMLRDELGFESFFNAFLSVFLMLYGNINYDVVLNHGSGWTRYTAHALLISYLVGAVTVLLNILIAMMATTYSDVWASAEEETMRGHALALLRMEKALSHQNRDLVFKWQLEREPSTTGPIKEDITRDMENVISFISTRSNSVGEMLASRLEQKKEMLADITDRVRALSPRMSEAKKAFDTAFDAAVETSPTLSAVRPMMQAGAASFRARTANFAPPNLDAMKEALYVKSAFDVDENLHIDPAMLAKAEKLAPLEDGVRFEKAVDKPTDAAANSENDKKVVAELKAQVDHLAAVAKELQAQQRKLMQINNIQTQRASLARYYTPPDGAGPTSGGSAAPQAV